MKRLSAGARRLYRYFQGFWNRKQEVFHFVATLARNLKQGRRTIERWTAELRQAGWIRKVRRGSKSSVYIAVENRINPAEGSLFLPQDGGKEWREEGPVSIYELQSETKTKPAPVGVENPKPKQKPRWSETEREAVAKTVAQFRYLSGQWVDPEPFLSRLERIAVFYGANGFRAAAEFGHVLLAVERSPSTAPERQAWFMAVLGARLKRSIQGGKSVQSEHRALAGRAAIGAQMSMRDPNSRPVYVGWTAEEMAELNRALDGEAAEPQAQSAEPERSAEPNGAEWCDTGALVREIASGKGMPDQIKQATLEELHQAIDRKAS